MRAVSGKLDEERVFDLFLALTDDIEMAEGMQAKFSLNQSRAEHLAMAHQTGVTVRVE